MKYYRVLFLSLALITALILPAACSTASSTSATSTAATTNAPASPATGQSVTINLISKNMAFDTNKITVPAAAQVTINFKNEDNVPHNFALYTDSSANKAIFVGKTITATSIVYTFTAPSTPGNYFFRCDVHPVTMTGTFTVQ
jgi:plastocyanin